MAVPGGQAVASSEYVPNGLRRSYRKKYAVKSTRVQQLFNGMTQRPAVLKEGYLQKPSFFRFGGKRKRWCVLRTYSAIECSLDIFMDDSKTRYKGSICLDKEAQPIIVVKSNDDRQQTYYMVLKVGKNSFHFTTESQKELKEWSALLRQVIDPVGSLFSASIVEPSNLTDGMVNVQFTSNYIALLCPLREISLKRWRLEHITSFGQCGGILTFECCQRCSDPNYSRCSLNIRQEKPATILSLMEKTIRDNPNTSEIHYERSILGDIYHCTHQCKGSPRLLPAFSDGNLARLSANSSPYSDRKKPRGLEVSMPPPDLHGSDTDLSSSALHNTLESHDSGLGTPQLDDSPHSSGFPSSPIGSNNSSPVKKSNNRYSSPSHRARSNSDRYTPMPGSSRDSCTPSRSETDDSGESDCNGPRGGGSDNNKILYNHLTDRSSVPIARSISPVKTPFSPISYNKLETVSEKKQVDPPTPPARRESRFRLPSHSPPATHSPPNTLSTKDTATAILGSPSKKYNSHIPIGVPPPPPKLLAKLKKDAVDHSRFDQIRDSSMDRDHPIADLSQHESSISNTNRLRSGSHISHRDLPPCPPRERAQSQSDYLSGGGTGTRFRPFSKSTSDELDEEDQLDDLKLTNPFFRLDELEYDETEGENCHEVMSNLADYRRHKNGYCEPGVIDKVLSKVACDNVRGYAYKISIPVAGNVVYDVPRRSAPMADPKHDNPYAPPKPLRKASEVQQHSLSHDDLLSSSES